MIIENKTPTYINILKNTLDAVEISSSLIEFKNPKDAVLFGLHSCRSYFPTNQGKINLFYDSPFWRGFDYLPRYKNILRDRKYVYIADYSYIIQKYPSSYEVSYILDLELSDICRTLEGHFGIDLSKAIITFTGGEDFYSVVGSFILRRLGYIIFPEGLVDPFVCAGVPDLVVAKLGNLQEVLIECGIIENGGFLAEVELWPIFGKNSRSVPENIIEEVLAVEVEPKARRASGGRKQIKTYLASGSFNNGILICPGREGDEEYYDDSFITWNKKGEPIVRITPPIYPKPKKFETAIKITKRILIVTLLKALALSKFPENDISFAEFTERLIEHPEGLKRLL